MGQVGCTAEDLLPWGCNQLQLLEEDGMGMCSAFLCTASLVSPGAAFVCALEMLPRRTLRFHHLLFLTFGERNCPFYSTGSVSKEIAVQVLLKVK